MRAALIRHQGALPELAEVGEPAGDTLEILAAPLNPPDLMAAAGTIPGADGPFPYVPGFEAVGKAPDGRLVWVFGDEIGYGTQSGGLAERLSLAGATVYDVPSDADPVLAAALGIAGMAGWLPLAWRAPLRAGETVLVLGATGAAGLVAVQAAKVLGASRVVAAGRNPARLARAAELGADATVRLDEAGDLAKAFQEACGGEGPTFVFDALWGPAVAAAIEIAAPDARVVTIGLMGGADATISNRPLRGRHMSLLGHSMYAVPADEFAAHYARLVALALAGEIVVDIERVPLADAADAWRRKTEGTAGKVVFVP
jgi:NADPH:quinone reductase